MTGIEQQIQTLQNILSSSDFESFNHFAVQGSLNRLQHIQKLWDEFEDIPMNPETECIESEFAPKAIYGDTIIKRFPAGTHREDIWHWFESEFEISVAKDLMYQ